MHNVFNHKNNIKLNGWWLINKQIYKKIENT